MQQYRLKTNHLEKSFVEKDLEVLVISKLIMSQSRIPVAKEVKSSLVCVAEHCQQLKGGDRSPLPW